MANEKRRTAMIPAGQVFDLAELVDYGDGAVVSRTLVGNSAGTVTLFAFDADQGLSEHTAPFDALVQVVDGEGDFTIAGQLNRLKAGQIVLMPAHVPHAVDAVSRLKFLLTMLRK